MKIIIRKFSVFIVLIFVLILSVCIFRGYSYYNNEFVLEDEYSSFLKYDKDNFQNVNNNVEMWLHSIIFMNNFRKIQINVDVCNLKIVENKQDYIENIEMISEHRQKCYSEYTKLLGLGNIK